MRKTPTTGFTFRVRKCLLPAFLGPRLRAANYGVGYILVACSVVACFAVAFSVAGSSPAGAAERNFSIAPLESRVVLLVFRDGLFSLLAHDHAMVITEISGTIRFDNEHVEKSSIRLSIPVKGIRVDPPEERQRLKLGGELSKEDILEIRDIMLSPRVLDAARFPTIEITSLAIKGTPGKLILDLQWRLRGVERVLSATAEVTVSGTVLRARGEMDLIQTHFGIKPYSTLLGTIAVKDRIRIKFDLVAREAVN